MKNKLLVKYDEINKFCERHGLKRDYSRELVSEQIKTKPLIANSTESGIINTRKINTTTKLSADGRVSNPMEFKRYLKMKAGLQKQGYTVIAAKTLDDVKYLRAIGAEAISDEYGIMHMGDIPSASAMFEEVIHLTQMKKYGILNNTDFVERTAREIAANRMLLKNAKSYGFTDEDVLDIKINLKKWEEDFLKKEGVSYDESEIKREI